MRNALFAIFSTGILLTALAPRRQAPANSLRVQAAWLAERESAYGDWSAVRAPLLPGDEVQLTVYAAENANLYVIADSDGERRQIFPPPNGAPALSRLRAGWNYGLPGRNQTWRIDGKGTHDTLFLVAARHALADPIAALAHDETVTRGGATLEVPLRDGRIGSAEVRMLAADDIVVDRFVAR